MLSQFVGVKCIGISQISGSHKGNRKCQDGTQGALEVERAFGLFNRDALHCMGVNHGGPYITMSQQLLNRPDIIIPLEQMTGKAVAKRMGGRTLTNS